MSFAERETSRDRGEPAEVYLFRYGATPDSYFAYTDAEESITLYDSVLRQNVTYEPVPISRDGITSSGTLDKATLAVRAPHDIGLSDLFRLYPPSHVVTLTIRQGHLNDSAAQYLVNWVGTVLGWQLGEDGFEVEYTCRPISTALSRPGLRRNYQYGCPHALYEQGRNKCNANKAAATSAHVVASVVGAAVGLGAGWTSDANKPLYEGGLAEWTLPDGRTEVRTILRAYTNGNILLGGYAIGLTPGASIFLSRGCDHLMSGCNLHNNILNFGGQPWIPTRSPVGIRNNFY